jgi:hypothetical protein
VLEKFRRGQYASILELRKLNYAGNHGLEDHAVELRILLC